MSDIKIGLIGGTGLGDLLRDLGEGTRHDIDTPFGKTSQSIVQTQLEGLSVFVLGRHGVGHTLNPSAVPYRANIFALKQLGVTHILASGAVGSLRTEYKPRDLVIADQIIDKTFRRAGTFFENAAVHVEFSEPFCPALRQILVEQGAAMKAEAADAATVPAVHGHGCYVCMEGPAFSTRAESLMHRLWGGDLIGMTAMPEAKLAREAEVAYALVALVTDYDCWKPHAAPAGQTATVPDAQELLKEIIGNVQSASQNAMMLIRRVLKKIAAEPEKLKPSPAHKALELAIWTDKSKLSPEDIQRLAPLWGRYFG